MKYAIGQQWHFEGREKIANRPIFHEFVEDGDHLEGFFISISDNKAEEGFDKSLFGYGKQIWL